MSDTVNPGEPHGQEAAGAGHTPEATPEHAVRYEHEDIKAGPIVWFLVGLVIVTALIFVGILGMMYFFNDIEMKSKKSTWEQAANSRWKKDEERQELSMPVGPGTIAGDEKRNRFRGEPGSDTPPRNRSSIGYTPRLEGIDLHNPDDPDWLPEHTTGRIHPSTAAEQRKREDAYLDSWSKYTPEGKPTHVPIEVAMQRLAVKGTAPLLTDEWQNAPGRPSSGRVSRAPDADKAAAQGHDAEVPKK
jgi:hypothetical protein